MANALVELDQGIRLQGEGKMGCWGVRFLTGELFGELHSAAPPSASLITGGCSQ